MNVLLDESVPRAFGFKLPVHHVRTVQTIGWSGFGHGKLLQAMSGTFNVLITCDQNIEHRQNPNLIVAMLILLVPDIATVCGGAKQILALLADGLPAGEVRLASA